MEGGGRVTSDGPSFPGFKSLKANFTNTPNQFFDKIIGHYPYRVATVVAILIRSTLGWEDPDTGERRIEAELALSDFVRPELSRSSARQGLRDAIDAGFIVQTQPETNRDGARYALRWADAEAQKRAIEKQRLTDDRSRRRRRRSGGVKIGPPKSRPPEIRPLEFTPPREGMDSKEIPTLEKNEKEAGSERKAGRAKRFSPSASRFGSDWPAHVTPPEERARLQHLRETFDAMDEAERAPWLEQGLASALQLGRVKEDDPPNDMRKKMIYLEARRLFIRTREITCSSERTVSQI